MSLAAPPSDDLERLAPLFDAYRQFYGQASDLQLAREFLAERFRRQESVVLVAETPSGELVGFTHSGTGTLVIEEKRCEFSPGDAFFVGAGEEHRFEDFSPDFSAWVVFWGPEGGEAASGTKLG